MINKDDSIYTGLYLFSIADSSSASFTGYKQWLTNPQTENVSRFGNSDANNQVLSDTARLGYKGNSGSVPFTLVVQYNFLDRFRIGAGIGYEIHQLPIMSPTVGEDILGQYVPEIHKTHLLRYFGMIGGKVYQIQDWSYFVDIQIGKTKFGNAFSKTATHTGLFFNIGFPMEYEFSEYFRAFIRPSVEFKNYQTSLEGFSAITTVQPAVYVHFGFRYNIPEIPRCHLKAKNPTGYDYPKRFTNKTCRIQKKHIHGDRMYRGQPFYKKQNPKVGQNYPVLKKYKLFNRRKMGGGY